MGFKVGLPNKTRWVWGEYVFRVSELWTLAGRGIALLKGQNY